MEMRVLPSALNGEIAAIDSKSDVHRLLICAALSRRPTEMKISNRSKDIQATLDCLGEMGCVTEQQKDGWHVINPVWGNIAKSPALNCGESGSTLRFLLPIAACVFESFSVNGGGRLPERPLGPIINAMKSNGCRFDKEQLPMSVSGKLHSGRFTLPGNVSSQFISGLLFALPLLKENSEIVISSKLESSGYIRMTINALRKFGIQAAEGDNGYRVPGGQEYVSPGTVTAEGDWSNAAFWLAAGAVNGDIACRGLNLDALQDDRRILDILKQMGADIHFINSTAAAKRSPLTNLTLDASGIPDLVPILAVVMAVAKGTSVIKNIGRLRLKESDRIHATAENLNAVGACVTELEDSLIIEGKPKLSGGTVNGFNDHRIVMAMAVAGAACEEGIVIQGAQAVDKSYPGFFSDFTKLGGKAHVV